MTGKIHPHALRALETFKIDPNEALWDCHGTWVIYHRYCEEIAALAHIDFLPPTVIYQNVDKGDVVLLVTGKMVDRTEWSFGEVSAKNNKNAYPWAMAEKRAKDRVILKLAGLSGHVYSEEEADEFKPHAAQAAAPEPGKNKPDENGHRPSGALSEKQVKFLFVLLKKKTRDAKAAEEALKQKFNVDSLYDIPWRVGKKVIDDLNARPDVEQEPPPDFGPDDEIPIDDFPF